MIPETFKYLIKKILPDRFIRLFTGLFYGWQGNYSTWEEASKRSSGYNSQSILNKVSSSIKKVRDGSGAYERDSVIFHESCYFYPLLAGLMYAAAQNSGKLNVLDYGGSLGSTFYQYKAFLESLESMNWCIVEQPEFVKKGREEFSGDKIHFYYTIDECLKHHKIDLILLSSVLQYLEKPYIILDKILSTGVDFIMIDRTPFIKGGDRITVQKVNPQIYKGSYPCWFFNKELLLNKFLDSYTLMFEFDSIDKANIKSEFKGFLFRKSI